MENRARVVCDIKIKNQKYEWLYIQDENHLGVFNQTLSFLLSKKSLSWRFIYFLSFGSHVQFPDFLPVTLGRLVFFSSTKRASKLACKGTKSMSCRRALSPNHSRSKQRTDQRVLVLSLKFLALIKTVFSPCKKYFPFFFYFCLP